MHQHQCNQLLAITLKPCEKFSFVYFKNYMGNLFLSLLLEADTGDVLLKNVFLKKIRKIRREAPVSEAPMSLA